MRWTFDLHQNDDIRSGPRWSPGTPALADGMLYVPTGDGDVLAINTSTAQEAWRWSSADALAGVQAYTRDGRSVLSSPIVSGDAVIVGASDGSIVALDRSTGAVRWSDSVDAPVISAPALSGNLLACGASDGWLYGWTGAVKVEASTHSAE
jgi:outer membrane protein assembly factor BamB